MSGNWGNWNPFRNDNAFNKNSEQPGQTGRKPREFVEEIRVSGQNLVSEVERILKEGEVRRLRIKSGERVLLDLPVAWAAIGAVLAPQIAAVGAVAAMVTHCTIEVIRTEDARPTAGSTPGTVRPAQPTTPPTNPDDLSFR